MGYSAVVLLSGNVASGVDQWNLRLKDLVALLKVDHLNRVVSLARTDFDSTVLPNRLGPIRDLLVLHQTLHPPAAHRSLRHGTAGLLLLELPRSDLDQLRILLHRHIHYHLRLQTHCKSLGSLHHGRFMHRSVRPRRHFIGAQCRV